MATMRICMALLLLSGTPRLNAQSDRAEELPPNVFEIASPPWSYYQWWRPLRVVYDKDIVLQIKQRLDAVPLSQASSKEISEVLGEDAWGCFTNPAITYIERLKILEAAKSLAARAPGIGYTGVNAVLGNNNLQEPGDWDGKLNTIANLRCDGLIEVCYEINDVDVWGMVRTPDSAIVHYDITEYTDEWEYHPVGGGWDHEANGLPDNLEEHNDFDSIPGDWKDTLQPATQSGHEPPVDADTKFQQQNLCIPVGSKGGN